MLVDIEFKPPAEGTVTRLDTGIYLCTGSGANDLIKRCYRRLGPFEPRRYVEPYVYDFTLDGDAFGWGDYLARDGFHMWCNYGHCDTVEQIRDFYGSFLDQPDLPMVVIVHELRWREGSQYRMCKNGIYIGDQHPQAEYLGDEPEIRRLLDYHFYALNGVTTADVWRAAEQVYTCFGESRETAWADLPETRRATVFQYTEMVLEMIQVSEDVAPRRGTTVTEVFAEWYYRDRKGKGEPQWQQASEQQRVAAREFVDGLRAEVRWLPAFA